MNEAIRFRGRATRRGRERERERERTLITHPRTHSLRHKKRRRLSIPTVARGAVPRTLGRRTRSVSRLDSTHADLDRGQGRRTGNHRNDPRVDRVRRNHHAKAKTYGVDRDEDARVLVCTLGRTREDGRAGRDYQKAIAPIDRRSAQSTNDASGHHRATLSFETSALVLRAFQFR